MARERGIKAGRAYVALGVDDVGLARGLAAAKRQLRTFGKVVVAIAAVFTAAAAAVSASIKVFGDFQEQMAKVSTMVDDTGKFMGALTEDIRNMSVEFGESTATLTDGLYAFLSAQIGASQATDVLIIATKAAVGGFTDVETSAKAMVRILSAYSIDASEAADVSDFLFSIVREGIINYEDLAENISKVAPTARSAGLSLEELGAAVVTALKMEEPARAMTALRSALFEATEAGMDLMSFVREFRGASLAAVMAAGIPKKAAQGVLILSSKYDELQEHIGDMANRAGAAEIAYQKMAHTLNREFKRMKQAALLFLSKVGEVFGERAKASIRAFTKVFLWAGDVVPAALKRIADFFEPLGRVAGYTFSVLMSDIKSTAVIFQYFSDLVHDVGDLMQKTLLGALKKVSFGFRVWDQLIRAAILAVAIGVVGFVNDLEHWFTVDIPDYLDWFGENWRNVFNDALKVIKVFATNVFQNMQDLWDAIRRVFQGEEWTFKPTGLLEGFESTIGEFTKSAERIMGPFEKDLKKNLKDTMIGITNDWRVHSEKFDKLTKGIVKNIKEAAAEAEHAREGLAAKFPTGDDQRAAIAGAARGIFMATSALSLATGGAGLDRQQVDELKKIAINTKEVAKHTLDIYREKAQFK